MMQFLILVEIYRKAYFSGILQYNNESAPPSAQSCIWYYLDYFENDKRPLSFTISLHKRHIEASADIWLVIGRRC